MDPYTFGNSAAAMRLSEILVEVANKKLSNRVGSLLHDYTARVAHIVESNMPLATKRWALNCAFNELSGKVADFTPVIVKNFTLNVAKTYRREALVNITRYQENY